MTMTQREPVTRVAVLIPTYNERDNLPGIVARVRASVPAADVVVLDDSSPDGTGEIADGLAATDPQVHVVHRAGEGGPRQGLPRRLRDRPRRGLRRGRRDGRRRLAPARAAARRCSPPWASADLVIGARWVRGGEVRNWPVHRKVLSVGANVYTKVLLGMHVNDATAGYRAYRTSALRTMGLAGVRVAGLLLPDRPDAAGRPGRPHGRRGADHVRRARGRRLEDGPRHRPRGPDERDPLGCGAPDGPAARGGRPGPEPRARRGPAMSAAPKARRVRLTKLAARCPAAPADHRDRRHRRGRRGHRRVAHLPADRRDVAARGVAHPP